MMRIILSPAKKMNTDSGSFPVPTLPPFLERAEELLSVLQQMTLEELKRLWRCNDQIAALNFERLQSMDLRRALSPAIFSYEGIAFQYMAPNTFTYDEFNYIQEHLRILSGLYGILHPSDGVKPYRLEIGAKLAVGGHKDLYGYWGDMLAQSICAETDLIINLASGEYSQTIEKHLLPGVRFVTVIFGERIDGKIVEKGTLCKMARGEMVRYMAERRIEAPEEMIDFDRLGYRFCSAESSENTYIFVKSKEDKNHA